MKIKKISAIAVILSLALGVNGICVSAAKNTKSPDKRLIKRSIVHAVNASAKFSDEKNSMIDFKITPNGDNSRRVDLEITPLDGDYEYSFEYCRSADMERTHKTFLGDKTKVQFDLQDFGTKYYFKVNAYEKSDTEIPICSSVKVFELPELQICASWDVLPDIFTPFAYESRKGITAEPSYSWTWAEENYVDKDTGIIRNKYGDYMCAMGTVFGYCGDRFKITMEDGSWFTVQIGDSKGDREHHDWGDGGCCIVEFIIDREKAEKCAYAAINSGTYQSVEPFYGNMKSIDKIG